jgi:ADP-heptose:LPS heptosyltransferase
MGRRAPRSVLIVAPRPLRAFVQATAAVRQIREAHPEARICLLVPEPFQPLARTCPHVDAVEIVGDAPGLGGWLALAGRLRIQRFERVYDLSGGGARALRLGLGPLPPAWVSLPSSSGRGRRHPLDLQTEALRDAGVGDDEGFAAPPDLSWIPTAAQVPRDAAARRAYALFIPAPSETPAEHQWPAERYGELGRMLRQRGYDVMIVGVPQDGDGARRIQHQVPGARDLTGAPDYARIAQLAARAAVAIGSDSSLLHLAVAAGAPGVVLCPCASDPALSAPRGHVTVLQAESLADLTPDNVMRSIDSLSPAGARSA